MEDQSLIILKLGGSTLSHSNKLIDFDYLREFRDLLANLTLTGRKFVVTIGGGQAMRNYMNYAIEEGDIVEEEDLHWIGTAVNTLNATIVRAFFTDELAEHRVWKYDDKDRIDKLQFTKPIVFAGGFEAGKSSDWVALQIAKGLKAYKIFDLKNVDGVYNEDPKKNPKAKRYDKLTWAKYLELIGNKDTHKPGDNLPVDPIAAKEADVYGAEYYILDARNFDNMENAILGDDFVGTLISNE